MEFERDKVIEAKRDIKRFEEEILGIREKTMTLMIDRDRFVDGEKNRRLAVAEKIAEQIVLGRVCHLVVLDEQKILRHVCSSYVVQAALILRVRLFQYLVVSTS